MWTKIQLMFTNKMYLWNTNAPAATESKYGQNLFKVQHFDPALPPGADDISEDTAEV